MNETVRTYPRIIFMGTPEFAVASLEAIIKNGYNVIAVVTAPDKPAGRGMRVTETAVKKCATTHSIPVLQPVKLKDPHFIDQLKELHADLQIVVAFRMLPENVWNMPPLGTINLHGSLLPQYRGAAPINHALINGEKETGVTTFKLQHTIDTGDILLQKKIKLTENTTAGELHDEMKSIGADLLVQTIDGLIKGTLHAIPQTVDPDAPLQVAPKIQTIDCCIDFNHKVDHVHNQIRGLSPLPGAFTKLHDKTFKIYFSAKEHTFCNEMPGTPVTDGKNYLKFACKDGYLVCKDVQMEGKKRMDIESFLRGYRVQ
ncbi:MAG: methionyl-tRNA formyltransferase [Bacteroidota bacterium]